MKPKKVLKLIPLFSASQLLKIVRAILPSFVLCPLIVSSSPFLLHSSQVKSSRVESSRVESSRVEWSGVGLSGVELSRVKWCGVESSRVESSGVDSS